jgi:hypothetical protein
MDPLAPLAGDSGVAPLAATLSTSTAALSSVPVVDVTSEALVALRERRRRQHVVQLTAALDSSRAHNIAATAHTQVTHLFYFSKTTGSFSHFFWQHAG